MEIKFYKLLFVLAILFHSKLIHAQKAQSPLDSLKIKTDTLANEVKRLNERLDGFSQKTKPKAPPCIAVDFCDNNCNAALVSSLEQLNLKKGDFFTVQVKGINPYRYNVKVTTKNDTLLAGKEPALFSEFMDPSKLGDIAATISSSLTALAKVKEADAIQAADTYAKSAKMRAGKKKELLAAVDNAKNDINSINKAKAQVKTLLNALEDAYSKISGCYSKSITNILNTQVDCAGKGLSCHVTENCECLGSDIKDNIKFLADTKRKLDELLNDKAIGDLVGPDLCKMVNTELNSGKYSGTYLNKIYAKAYANFLIAENTALLSTYNSFPIQVQGDMMELKIDITPKESPAASPAKDDAKKKQDSTAKSKARTSGQKNNNALSNQSPLTININTADKAAGKEAKASPIDTSGPEKNTGNELFPDEDLKITMPAAVFERHLNYKFRTSTLFYGFSTGFFVDWLGDESFTNKPVNPNDPNTQYVLVRESNKSPNKYGIMASVNGGVYIYRQVFLHAFAGPGLSIETKLQPRLLIGGGIGWGDNNKFSLNGGIAIGQVKKLSNAFDNGASYSVQQTDLYYNTTAVRPFVAISYIFDARRDK